MNENKITDLDEKKGFLYFVSSVLLILYLCTKI